MEVKYKVVGFEGPLELLLHLVQKNKVDIYDIPVAEILSQFMDYLGSMESENMEIATDFMVMAATLLYLKSRMLLPKSMTPDAEDPRLPLAEALAEYRRFKRMSELLAIRLPNGQDIFAKQPELLAARTLTGDDYRHKPDDILRAIHRLTLKEERKRRPSTRCFDNILKRENVTVEEKQDEILAVLARLGRLDVNALIAGERNKAHAVAAFLAVLELCGSGKALLQGDASRPTLIAAARSTRESNLHNV